MPLIAEVRGGMQTTQQIDRMEWTPISPQYTLAHAVRREKSRRTQFKLALVQLADPCIYTHLLYTHWLIGLPCQKLF